MMLIAALAIWLTLVVFFVALCRGAASADGRDARSSEHYPTIASTHAPLADVPGLVLLEDQAAAPAPRELRPRARGARGRAGQYAAGS